MAECVAARQRSWAVQLGPEAGEVEALLGALREQGWPGDDVFDRTAHRGRDGTGTGRGRLVFDLDMLVRSLAISAAATWM